MEQVNLLSPNSPEVLGARAIAIIGRKLLGLAVLLSLSIPANAALGYDHINRGQNSYLWSFQGHTIAADDITLDSALFPTGGRITSMRLSYYMVLGQRRRAAQVSFFNNPNLNGPPGLPFGTDLAGTFVCELFQPDPPVWEDIDVAALTGGGITVTSNLIGYELHMLEMNDAGQWVPATYVYPVFSNGPATVGSTADLFYLDVDHNNLVMASEQAGGGYPPNPGLAVTLTMQPVPEPTTLAALGLGGLALVRRKARRTR